MKQNIPGNVFRKMKHGFYILLFCLAAFTSTGLKAQNEKTEIIGNEDVDMTSQPTQSVPAWLNRGWNISLGSSYTYSPQFGSLTGFTVSPVYTMPLTSRLSIYGGVIFSKYYSPVGAFFSEPGVQNQSGMISLTGSASYKLNDHILVYGSGVKHFGSMPLPSYLSPYNSDSFTIGSMFKVGDHFSLGASFKYSNEPYNNLYPYNSNTPFFGQFPFIP